MLHSGMPQKGKERRREGRGRKGTKVPTDSFGRYVRRAKMAGCSDHYRHEPAWNAVIQQIFANNFGASPLRPLWARTSPGRGDKDKHPFNERVHSRLSLGETHL